MNDTTDDFRQSVENEDGTYPDNWTPDVGDTLFGELVEYTKGHSRYGEFWIANVRDEDTGEVLAVWLSDVVLQDLFKRKKPRPGQRVGIKRLEDDPDKQYHRYTLKIDRDEGEQVPDFDDADPPRDEAAVRAGNSGDGVADEVEQQRQQQDDDGVDLPEGDPDEDIPF